MQQNSLQGHGFYHQPVVQLEYLPASVSEHIWLVERENTPKLCVLRHKSAPPCSRQLRLSWRFTEALQVFKEFWMLLRWAFDIWSRCLQENNSYNESADLSELCTKHCFVTGLSALTCLKRSARMFTWIFAIHGQVHWFVTVMYYLWNITCPL